MKEAALSLVRRFWRYALAAALLVGVALLAWTVILDALAWSIYRSHTEPVYSVRYLNFLEVRPNYVDPSYAASNMANGVNFEYPALLLQGSKVSSANLTVTPVPEGGSCDAATYAMMATSSATLAEKGVTYSYVRFGRQTDTTAALEHIYIAQGTPCMMVRYHINFIFNNGFDPDAPPSFAQGRTYARGKIQFDDIMATFDIMRRSLNVKR